MRKQSLPVSYVRARGDSILEHDPSLGLESLPTLVTSDLVLVLVGSASVIAIVVLAVRWKRKTVNIVGTR